MIRGCWQTCGVCEICTTPELAWHDCGQAILVVPKLEPRLKDDSSFVWFKVEEHKYLLLNEVVPKSDSMYLIYKEEFCAGYGVEQTNICIASSLKEVRKVCAVLEPLDTDPNGYPCYVVVALPTAASVITL
jgi:hypothetical protein